MDYVGATCQYTSPCKARDVCHNHGYCNYNTETGGARCECYKGYYGIRCHLQEDNGSFFNDKNLQKNK